MLKGEKRKGVSWGKEQQWQSLQGVRLKLFICSSINKEQNHLKHIIERRKDQPGLQTQHTASKQKQC